jgi:DNA polymerase-3 subunit delta'
MPLNPRANFLLESHENAEKTLYDSTRAGRLHHAWLITGPPGIGKATLAFRFARWLLAGAPGTSLLLPQSHPVFHRVAAGSHADLLTVELAWDDKKRRQRSEIVVDDVRDVGNFLRLTPAEGGWRVVVVDGAEALNRNAANALLKVLEEPPARAVLLLVCSAPGRLLPTIRSRCRTLRLSPLSTPAMLSLLAPALPNFSRAELADLVALSDGAPGRALQLAEEEGLAVAGLVRQVLSELPSVPVARAYAVADALGRSDSGFATFMELLRAGVAQAVVATARGRADPQQARLAALRPLEAWTDVWHRLSRLQDDTEHSYLDKRQAIIAGLGYLSGK